MRFGIVNAGDPTMRPSLPLPALLSLSLLALASCSDGGGGGPTNNGPAAIIVNPATDNQHTNALRDSLGAGVQARLVRIPSAGLASRIGSWLVTPAHAQTTVVGIAGETVCAVPIRDAAGQGGLTPWNNCATTGQDGNAIFFFDPPTRAGRQCAEIRGVVNGLPVIPDSACADVEAGPASRTYDTGLSPILAFPMALDSLAVRDQFGNAVRFRVEAADSITVASDSVGTTSGRTVNFTGTVTPCCTQRYLLRLLDGASTHVANLLVLVQGDGLGSWQAAGLDRVLN